MFSTFLRAWSRSPGTPEPRVGPTTLRSVNLLFRTNLRRFDIDGAKNVSIPAAVSVFPGERYQAPRSWAERAYPKLIHYNKVEKGGHFAAWEQPQLFSEEVRAGFRGLR